MVTLSIQHIKDMKGTYSIELEGIKKYIRITEESIVIFSKVKSDMVEDIQEILSSPEAESIRKGFEKGIAVKEFCKKCSFRTRFRK